MLQRTALACVLVLAHAASADEGFVEAPLPAGRQLSFAGQGEQPLPSTGSVSVLVVFARFADEAGDSAAPPDFAGDLFAPDRPGSFTHFYRTMSAGQLQVAGTVLPRDYTASRPRADYLVDAPDVNGRFGEFVEDILRQVDAEHDLGRFDNDGPDGVPNSGDDDGAVDYLFVCLRSTPRNFIYGGATGIARLGQEDDFVSDDAAAGGGRIRVRDAYGSLLRARSFAWTVGSMAHEFGHALGLPDLYDTSHQEDPEQADADYSAGIGRWGLMGTGTLGWQRDGVADGPNPLSAWSLAQLGWLGRNNERLVEVTTDTTDLELADPFAGGAVVRVPLRTVFSRRTRTPLTGDLHPEYLLLEDRRRDSHHYNRHQPAADGVLVWHVRAGATNNDDERRKRVDLVCADGLFGDGGFGSGVEADAIGGRDNLDFWAPDERYRRAYGGNEGDGTDPFDGVRYTALDADSNPSAWFVAEASAAFLPVAIRFHRRRDGALAAAIRLPYWAGTIREEVHWAGAVRVAGDVLVETEGRLIVYPNTHVRVLGEDRTHAGRDPARVEIRVHGRLEAPQPYQVYRHEPEIGARARVAGGPAVFRPADPGRSWGGLSGVVDVDPARIQVEGDRSDETGEGGVPTVVRDEGASSAIRDTFALGPPYPNPFAEETNLEYSLPEAAPVRLTVYNALGQAVRGLVDGEVPPGQHRAIWERRDAGGRRVASGVYLALFEVPGRFAGRRKMLVLDAGFSRWDRLEERLRSQGHAASVLDVEPPPEAFGAIADPLPAQVAFTLGVLAARHEAASRAGDAATAAALRRRVVVLTAIETATEGAGPFDALVGAWLAGNEDLADALYLGRWVQVLGAATQAAQQLGLPLDQLLDPAADAAAARQFAGLVADDPPVPGLPERLRAVAAVLDEGVDTRAQRARLTEALDELMDGMMVR